jgi:hypothetical protein
MYTFSYYLPREVATIAPRPWWKPWAKPQIVYKTQYERQYYELTEAEAELLINSDSAVVALVRKLIPGATMWQLEQGKPTTPYVRTTT